MIKGTVVILIQKVQKGTDSFGAPIYEEKQIPVRDVLVGEPSSDDISNSLSMYGKKLAYTLAIPKGDANDWIDTDVIIFGKRFRTYGMPTEGIESNIPLRWNKKVKVERYE